jgi:hypothetical protein
MTGARIVVDASTLKPGSLGPATGSVWLDVEGVGFPMHGWNDFIVVVLGLWAAAVLRILRGDRGPHEINCVLPASVLGFPSCSWARRSYGVAVSGAADCAGPLPRRATVSRYAHGIQFAGAAAAAS